MVKRVFMSDNPPTVDQFDCIIVDEAHRGYTLDQDMTEGELATRDANQYLSTYRRVLDYFDAVKIGLTATPAKHTSEVFGKPVYTYSYREAVADDWLIDHEPPIRYETLLTQKGIKFEKGAVVCRVAPSFIRFGNFQIFAARKDVDNLRKLTDYTIRHFFPNIEVGNSLVKMMIYFMGACAAGVVVGGKVPIVITSRSDEAQARLASIAAAVVALD